MKRFYISLISVITVVSAWACGGNPFTENFCHWDNYYMFSVINRECFDTDHHNSSTDWDKYVGEKDVYSEYDLEHVDLSKFNQSKNKIIRTAIKRNDTETINYLKLIIEFSQNCNVLNDWDYPTKKELAHRKAILNRIKKNAKVYKGTRYRNQYAYLVMRCNMVLEAHQDNVLYWQTIASRLKSKNFKHEMKNIYAGALYNTGQKDKACDIFVEMGDMTSIKYCVRKDRNLKGIKEQYAQNPNRPTLIFLVQDFVNNTQESIDCNYDDELIEFAEAKTILKRESMAFVKFAERVLKEGKTKSPCLWQTARGMINYLYGNQTDALKQLEGAQNLAGTQRMRDNARACLALVRVKSAQPTQEFYDYMLGELKWLEKMSGKKKYGESDYESNYFTFTDPHYQDVINRIASQGLMARFREWNMPEAALATHFMVDSLCSYYDMSFSVNSAKDELDSIPSDQFSKFCSYVKSDNVSNLEQWINSHVSGDDFLNDYMGTKLIREGKFQEAIPYLEKVPLDYYSSQEISLFMNQRDYKKERWMKQQTKQAEPNNNWRATVSNNDKISFCRDIIGIDRQIANARGEHRLQLMYEKASMLFQASYYGDCWYISQYYTSIYKVPQSASILADKAITLLKEVEKSTTDNRLHLKSLYAQSYFYGRTDGYYYQEDWNDKGERYSFINTGGKHYQALRQLNNFINQNNLYSVSFISKCDVIKEFRKAL